MAAEPTAVEYIGKDGAYIPGKPAADHVLATKSEAEELVASAPEVYRLASGKKKAALLEPATEPAPDAPASTTEKPAKGEGA